MGRLIDADTFIEDIKTEIINLAMDGLKGTPRSREELYQIIERINEQPTAYDVEKVVEQLEKATKMTMPVVSAKEAINIVRAGGKE